MPHGKGMDWIRLWKRMAIYYRDRFDCVWCRCVFPLDILGSGLTLDHLDPAGSNDPQNLVTACHSCNSTRQDLPVQEWIRILASRGHCPREIRARLREAALTPLSKQHGLYLAKLRRPNYSVARKETRVRTYTRIVDGMPKLYERNGTKAARRNSVS